MSEILDPHQARPAFLAALLYRLGRRYPGLSYDSIRMIGCPAFGCDPYQFTVTVSFADGDVITLNPVYLRGFTLEQIATDLAAWCELRFAKTKNGLPDPHGERRQALKTARFTRAYGGPHPPEDEEERITCLLVGLPTQEEIDASRRRERETEQMNQNAEAIKCDFASMEMRIAKEIRD